MKKSILISVIFSLVLSLSFGVNAADDLTILFTHDTHSHLTAGVTEYGGISEETGGFAKLKTAIDAEKAKYPQALLVDGGDFSMGTLFQTIYTEKASELRMLGALGYDFTTLGNHEFDYRTQGLTAMLKAAMKSGDPLPRLLTANIDWDATYADDNLKENATELNKTLSDIEAKPYEIIKKNGISVAVFGLLGKQAVDYAPLSGLYFSDAVDTAKSVVAEIKAEDPNAIIVCLSHSGTSDDKKSSEDEILAKEVADIDVIVSGHTHSTLDKPIVVGKTLIVSAGEYTKNLGSLTFSLDGNNSVVDYRVIPLNSGVTLDQKTLSVVNEFKEDVESDYLAQYNYKFDEALAFSPFDFTPIEDFAKKHQEDTLGNLIADSYIYGAKISEGDNYEAVNVAVVPSGVVRGSLSRGDITVSDIFNVSSLGVGPDEKTGYPLVSVYLDGKELKAACEVDASVSSIMSEAQLYMSGLNFTFNPHRLFLNRVTNLQLVDEEGKEIKIEDDKLYRVVADLYSAQMLGTVKDMSMNLLSLTPKDKDGKEVTDFEKQIIYDSEGNELKAWVALAGYMDSFAVENGLPLVPQKYSQAEGRKIIDDDNSLGAKLANPNKITFMLVGAVVGVLLVIFLLVFIPVKLYKRKKRKKI